MVLELSIDEDLQICRDIIKEFQTFSLKFYLGAVIKSEREGIKT